MNNNILPYAHVIIRLFQGIVYNDMNIWNDLIEFQSQLKEYFSAINVDLFVSENDGFAFLKNYEHNDEEIVENEEIPKIPDLFSKRQLSFQVTLLSVLLLERLIEFDISGGDSTRLIYSKEDIKELVRVFLPENSNEAKYIDNIDTNINRLLEYGFLKKLNNNKDEYEVKRILKAKINAEKLVEIKERLTEYVRRERA